MPSPDQLLNELKIDRRGGAPKKKRRWPIYAGIAVIALLAFFVLRGGKPVPVEEVLDAFVRPFATQVRRSELSEKLFFKLMGRMFGQEGCNLPPVVETLFVTMLNRFQKAFAKSLPGLAAEDVWWRIHLMAGAMIHTMAHADTLQRFSGGDSGSPTLEQTLSRFIRFAAAGMRQGADEPHEEEKPKGPQVEFPF